MKKIDLSFKNPCQPLEDYVGQDLKYGEICKILNQEERHGKGLQTQINNWMTYVDMEKVKKTYHINRIFTENDVFIINASKRYFTKYFEQHLVNMFYAHLLYNDNPTLVLTNKDIMENFLVTKKFFKYLNSAYAFSIEEFVEPNKNKMGQHSQGDVIRGAFNLSYGTYRTIKNMIRSGLRSLHGKRIIEFSTGQYKLYKNKIIDGKYIPDRVGHACNDEEIGRVVACEQRAMRKFNEDEDNIKKGYRITKISYARVLTSQKKQEFKELISDEIRKEFAKEGYNARARAYKIVLTPREDMELCAKNFDKTDLFEKLKDKWHKSFTNVTPTIIEQWSNACFRREIEYISHSEKIAEQAFLQQRLLEHNERKDGEEED